MWLGMLRVAQISSSPQKREDVGCPILLVNPADSCEFYGPLWGLAESSRVEQVGKVGDVPSGNLT